MARNPYSTTFDPRAHAHRTMQEWAFSTPSTRRNGKRQAYLYAKFHGEAKLLLASGAVIRYWREDNTVRQKTYTKVIMVRPL